MTTIETKERICVLIRDISRFDLYRHKAKTVAVRRDMLLKRTKAENELHKILSDGD